MNKIIEKDSIVTCYYSLKFCNGEPLESTTKCTPAVIHIGQEQMPQPLENELIGMTEKETKTVTLKPQETFGAYNPLKKVTLDKNRVPDSESLEIGDYVEVETAEGDSHKVVVRNIEGDHITFDLNHHLAGRTLLFDVSIIEIS